MSLSVSLASSFFDTSADSNGLLHILYGGDFNAAASLDSNPLATLKVAEVNGKKLTLTEGKDPSVARDVKAFTEAVNKAPDLKTLLADPQARKVFLTANGLGDSVDYVALAQKVLASDPANPKSLINQLSDKRWLTLSKTFALHTAGLTNLKSVAIQKDVTDGYAATLWQKQKDVNTPGLSAALEFRSRAHTITSALQILGDHNLRNVVTTALGLPLDIAIQPTQTQEAVINSRLNVKRFQDPKFVESFTQRFLLNSLSNAGSAAPAGLTGLVSLFA